MARLQAAAGAASALAGHLGRSTAPALCARPGGPGGRSGGQGARLASDPKDRLAAALARLGRAFMARELVSFPGVHELAKAPLAIEAVRRPSTQSSTSSARSMVCRTSSGT